MRTGYLCIAKVYCDPDMHPLRMTAFADCFPTEADEAYVIGKRGQYTPVGAYLAGDEIIKIAVEHGAQLVHPGSFLSPLSNFYSSI